MNALEEEIERLKKKKMQLDDGFYSMGKLRFPCCRSMQLEKDGGAPKKSSNGLSGITTRC